MHPLCSCSVPAPTPSACLPRSAPAFLPDSRSGAGDGEVWSWVNTSLGAGVCKVDGRCLADGAPADSPDGALFHSPGDRMGCKHCDPLQHQAAWSPLPYPKRCHARTSACDADAACDVAQMTCGHPLSTRVCRPPAWDAAMRNHTPEPPDYEVSWTDYWAEDPARPGWWFYDDTWGDVVDKYGAPVPKRVYACHNITWCDGVHASCPPVAFHAGGECRTPGSGACDLPEACPGDSLYCPADAVRAYADNHVCKPPRLMTDVASNDAYLSAAAAADLLNEVRDYCNGTGAPTGPIDDLSQDLCDFPQVCHEMQETGVDLEVAWRRGCGVCCPWVGLGENFHEVGWPRRI